MIPFGRAWRSHFPLDPEIAYLNHGTRGVTPREVMGRQHAIQEAFERDPARSFRELPARLRVAADRVAGALGARGDDIVFTENVTTAINGALRSLPLEPGDGLAITNLTYGGIAAAARAIAAERGLTLHEVVLPFPVAHPDDLTQAFADGLPHGTRLAIVDHTTADTALVLPIADIAAICRERGTLLLVDAAHAPGMVPLDIGAIGADLYAANLHKWMWVPRSCGILWVRPELQPVVRPPVVSWGHDGSFHDAFAEAGTRDPSAWLTAPAALDMLERVGMQAVIDHNHELVCAGGRLLAERWGTAPMAPASMLGAMVAVPWPEHLARSPAGLAALQARLCAQGIEVHAATDGTRAWVRVAAQIYNELDDFARLAEAVG